MIETVVVVREEQSNYDHCSFTLKPRERDCRCPLCPPIVPVLEAGNVHSDWLRRMGTFLAPTLEDRFCAQARHWDTAEGMVIVFCFSAKSVEQDADMVEQQCGPHS